MGRKARLCEGPVTQSRAVRACACYACCACCVLVWETTEKVVNMLGGLCPPTPPPSNEKRYRTERVVNMLGGGWPPRDGTCAL